MLQYFYDAENRIIQVNGTHGDCSNVIACYVYDAEGRRVRKITDSQRFLPVPPPITIVDYLYDLAGHQVAEVDSMGNFLRGELFAGDHHFATYAPEPGPTGATFFTHSDWLGTERARTDMTGATCESIASLPFGDGQSITETCGDVSPLHFTGKERGSESGLDNFGARYFGGSMGRFMSPDEPLLDQHANTPQSWNLYSYVRNNPLNYTDADGEACVSTDRGQTFHDDNSGGQSCKDAQEPQKVQVNAQPGSWAGALVLNFFFAKASNFFRPITNAMGIEPSYMQDIRRNNRSRRGDRRNLSFLLALSARA